TSATSLTINGKTAGTYYYRVKGRTTNKPDTAWSNIQSVAVLVPAVPTLNPINNPSHGGGFTVTWNQSARATVYLLQGANNPGFSNPNSYYPNDHTYYSLSSMPAGIWYFRVKAIGPTGESGWSNVQSTLVCGGLAYNETLRWNMDMINAPEAWACSQGGLGVIIAIIDSGISSNHPDLQAHLVTGYSAIPGTSWEDETGHGTHVAGIAAGIANNGGILGVAPRASIMPVRVLDSTGHGSFDWIANGITWAVNHGAKVINLSLGSIYPSQSIYNAVIYAYNSGVVIIAAAGNCGDISYSVNGCDYQDQTVYPAAFPGVLAVAAIDNYGYQASFSSAGNWVAVTAPGDPIFSSFPWDTGVGRFKSISGTSQAAPHVAGLAALIKVLRPTWTPNQVYVHIINTATDITYYGYGWDPYTGYGLVNANSAIANLASITSSMNSVESTDSLKPFTFNVGQPDPVEFVPGEVLYALIPGVDSKDILAADSFNMTEVQSELAIDEIGIYKLHVPVGQEQAWLARLRANPNVAYAELNGVMHLQ
ncbi:MAG: S8 family serine peptidase, partial [Anaerolineae bacterium]